MAMARVYIGLGSNLEGPREQLCQALQAIATRPQIELLAVSSLYRSTPMGPADQPDYLNAVAALQTELEPLVPAGYPAGHRGGTGPCA